MKTIPIITLALFALAFHTASAENKILVNVDKQGVGIQGYDPVGFFKDGKPVKGNPTISQKYHGVIYHFATEANRNEFAATPGKYEPQFGGYCAYGVSRDNASPIKVEAFQIVGGRLLMQYDTGVRDLFNKDTIGNLQKADEKWPGVIEKKGKAAR